MDSEGRRGGGCGRAPWLGPLVAWLAMGMAITACAPAGANRGDGSESGVSSNEAISIGLVVPGLGDLPACTRSSVGQVAFVENPSGLFGCGIANGLLAWKEIPCTDRAVGTVAYASVDSWLVACIATRWTAIPLPMGAEGKTGPVGPAGQAGSDGLNGAAGATSLVALGEEPMGDHCTYGGVRVDAGLDLDANGVLAASEITTTAYVCAGAPGPAGPPGPTAQSLAALAGSPCTAGGRSGTLAIDVDAITGVATLRCELPPLSGDGTLGSPCRADGGCDTGLRCAFGICLSTCATDADCTDHAGPMEPSTCWVQGGSGGVCTLPCLATSPDASGCQEGTQCTVERNPTTSAYVTTCIAASAPSDTTCSPTDTSCAPGSVCGGDLGCLAICDDPSGARCASGVCTILSGSRYGVCEP